MSDRETGPTQAERLRVLIVDDHALFRRGLRAVLGDENDIEVVGEAGDGAEAVQRAGELRPDIVLMDVRMPRSSGIEATARIREVAPQTQVLMLTVSDEESDLYEAIKAGASGYLLKEIPTDEVADAIRSVRTGQSRISPAMAAKLLSEFASPAHAARTGEEAPRLTTREMDVLRLMAAGRGNKEIARGLYISENTVKNHVRSILDKLHLRSRMEAVVYAVKERLVETDVRPEEE